MDELIARACNLDNEPLSLRTPQEISESYQDGPTLVNDVKSPENQKDFHTKFISEHEQFTEFNDDGLKMRIAHNLDKGVQNYDEVYLFIHGLGGNFEQFEPLLRLVDASDKKFLTMDLPGFGKSDELESYGMFDIIEVINYVAKKFIKDGKSINVIGHSMGCLLSIHFMEKFSKELNITQLVLLTPPNPEDTRLSRSNYLTRFVIGSLFKWPGIFDIYRNRFDQNKGLESSGIKQFFYNNDDTDLVSRYRKLWQFHNNVQNRSRTVVGYLYGWESVDWERINQLSITNSLKVRVVGANKDIVTPIEDAEIMLEGFTAFSDKELLLIENSSHNVCFDAPAQICTLFYKNIF
ncbi:hypothetical protein Kpol_299p6 [Vanderwaltozyma polyspora DSM 70294]|uniref:AB hydrolase-1 domain-containing protein n=1 Tax=Vanderwaltozyma polyspora (strain ATCC 22028 / DSM 70294 / BCRC 21397 / CBS 2163 / NBRC 10782 / NRRL Y-8283 / UCD 57-17) TaxID=436907 RepID=A7TSW4_VANPO|nr:uncharacterized protein Kpol_299p6 [Vanderwaltozyma polyspora DSM 70294]EDO14646.1 hypothetical protein Kpol_299p6 [Vanderwaltozyma polyspora DSM 70294]